MSHTRPETLSRSKAKDFCCICHFNYPELKWEGNKYHQWCYEMHMKTHNPPPEYLVKQNRSKD